MIRPQQLSTAWLSRECDSGSWNRGSRYFRDGRASLGPVERLPDGGVLLTGSCQGSAFEPYRQRIEITQGQGGIVLDGECSCPVGFNCKHVIAMVLTWRALASDETGDPAEVDIWLKQLTADDTTSENNGALLYSLSPDGRESGVGVSLIVARPKTTEAGWTSGRKASVSSLASNWYRPDYVRHVDNEILSLIRGESQFSNQLQIAGAAGHLALVKMVESGRAFWCDEREHALTSGDDRPVEIQWRKSGAGYRIEISVGHGGMLITVDPPCFIDPDENVFGRARLPPGVDLRKLEMLSQAPAIPLDDARRISRRIALSFPDLPTPVEVAFKEIRQPPTPLLHVRLNPSDPAKSEVRLGFAYGETIIAPDHSESVIVTEAGENVLRVHRDADAEDQARQRLADYDLEPLSFDSDRFRITGDRQGTALRDAWFGWLETSAPGLQAAGWQISQSADRSFTVSESDGIDGEIESEGNDWFSLRFDLEFDGWTMPLLPLVSQLIEHYQPDQLPDKIYLDTGEGHFVGVPAEQIEPVLKTILDLFDRVDDDQLMLSKPDAPRLLDLEGMPIRGATSLKKLARKMADFSGLKMVRPPTTFKGTLRDYQQHGLNWLQFLREYELSGILADDMGLGKTVQTLAHLAVEKRAGRMRQPSLLVAPTSLMGNWRREAAQFTPGLKVLVLHGPNRTDDFARMAEFDLVLTTYPLLPRDRKVLLRQPWHYLILDEAQQIKNPGAQAAQVVRALSTNHRLCLTGTPMENHLGELWAQFDFLMPGFLGDRESFNRNYRTPIEKYDDDERLDSLNQRIAPFLLRRTKDRVAAELPPKTELLRSTGITGKQAQLYESIRLTMEKKVREAISAKGLGRSHIVVLEALLKLRQVCCDPRLLPATTAGVHGAPSAKMELLLDLLPGLLEDGRRVLLFSQFTTMLGLIERELETLGIEYAKLTGQTRKRDQAIERFRSGEVNLFLISLKAGGVGLNLVEADTVIHYDPWWNPAVEHQATDRAHRIGQDKPVFIYKLVTEGTVEEKILVLQQRKQKLADGVYGEGRRKDEPPITEDTIRALLSAG